jgi:hypothetical protein
MPDFKSATRAHFFARINSLDVHPRVDVGTLKGRYHVSYWEMPDRRCIGKSVSDSYGIDATVFFLTD